MLERMWRKGNTVPLLKGMHTFTAILEISMAGRQGMQNHSTTGPANSKNLEATKMPLNCRMDKESLMYLHNGILLSRKTQWNLEICRQMDGN